MLPIPHPHVWAMGVSLVPWITFAVLLQERTGHLVSWISLDIFPYVCYILPFNIYPVCPSACLSLTWDVICLYLNPACFMCLHHIFDGLMQEWGWVGLWGFLWWAPSAKRKDHHGVNSGWSSVWHRSNTGLSSTQYEQIPIIIVVWPFWLTPFFFRSIIFWWAWG